MAEVIDVLAEEEDMAREAPRKEPEATQAPALEVLKRTHMTPLEAKLFDILINTIGELNENYPKVPGLEQLLLDCKLDAMSQTFREKFRVQSLDQARQQKFQLTLRPDNTIELCRSR